MLLKVAVIEGVTVVRIRVKRISTSNCLALKNSVASAVDFLTPTVIDLSATERFDSSGLSLIVHWFAEGRRAGGAVFVCASSPQLQALIELVRIPSFATVYSSLENALNACAQSGSASSTADHTTGPSITRVRAATASGA